MTYGHYETNTIGEKRFIAEGCSYCSMSTGGQHSSFCPYKPNEFEYPQVINKNFVIKSIDRRNNESRIRF